MPTRVNPGNTDPKRTIPGGLCMFGNGRGIIQDRVAFRFSMAADDKKLISPPLASEESDERGTDNDERE